MEKKFLEKPLLYNNKLIYPNTIVEIDSDKSIDDVFGNYKKDAGLITGVYIGKYSREGQYSTDISALGLNIEFENSVETVVLGLYPLLSNLGLDNKNKLLNKTVSLYLIEEDYDSIGDDFREKSIIGIAFEKSKLYSIKKYSMKKN